jgi:cell wall-associated NlpC family hydrolase
MMSAGGLADLLAPAFPALANQRVAVGSGGGASQFNSSAVAGSQSLGILLRDWYEPDNTPAQARRIAMGGQFQVHTINRPGDVDWVKFTLTERSAVVIQTDGRAGNTDMTLFGPDDSSSQIAYDNGNGGMARIDLHDADALQPGTYYVEVGEFGRDATIAGYTLSARATPAPLPDGYEPDDAWQQAQSIGVNAGPQTHSIHVANDVDWATFQLTTAADVVIETRGVSGDTRMWLYGSDPDASPIEFDDNDGVGKFSVIVRSGDQALGTGTYYVKVDEAGHDAVIGNYTLSVTSLQQGDVLLTQGKGGLSSVIRVGEALELKVAFADTFSHSAIYVGNGQVAEMLADGFTVTPLAERYAASERVDILRDLDIGRSGAAVVDAAMQYANTPYALAQIGVFATAVAFRENPRRVANSLAYAAYKRVDSGPRRMICSELVARAFDDALLPIDVKLWPTLAKIGNQGKDFRMDFTSPTMLSLSPDLERLNA